MSAVVVLSTFLALTDASAPEALAPHPPKLEFSGGVRSSYELFVSEDYGQVPQDDSGSWLLRLTGGANLKLGSHGAAHFELVSAHEAGRDTGPNPFDADPLAIQSGYVELSSKPGSVTASIRLGRQALSYGRGRLVDPRLGPNLRRSFDAVRAFVQTPLVNADVVFGLEVPVKPGILDNRSDGSPKLWGAFLSTPEHKLGGQKIELYYLGVQLPVFRPGTATQHEIRHSLGSRVEWSRGRFRQDAEAIIQFGHLQSSGEKLRAWGLATDVELNVGNDKIGSFLGLSTGITSGDRQATADTNETFRAPFPNLRFSGPTTRLGPANLFGSTLSLGLQPTKQLNFEIGVAAFWRTRLDDAIYTPFGTPQRQAESDARYVGWRTSVIGHWQLDRHLGLFAMAELFKPGRFIHEAGEAKPSGFFNLALEVSL